MRVLGLLPLLALAPVRAAQEPEAPTHLGRHLYTIHGLSGPSAVAFGADGDLWVVESETGELLRFGPDGAPLATAELPTDARPHGLAVDGALLVSEPLERRARAFDGAQPAPWSVSTDPLVRPLGVDLEGERWAVADAAGEVWFGASDGLGRRVESRSADGAPLLREPVDVALLEDGGLLVLDAGLARVERFDARGEPLGGFGDWGAFPGLLADPRGIDVWRGRVFVADTANHRVQVFDLDGTRRYAFGTHAILPRQGKGRLHYPGAIAVSPDGERLAVAEPLDDRVQVFGRAPGAEPEADPLRAASGQPSPHAGFDLAADGTWMISAEPDSCRVHVYDTRRGTEPIRVTTFGRRGTTLGRYLRPTGVEVDQARRRVLVCDPVLRVLDEVELRLDPAADLGVYPGAASPVRRLAFDRLERPVLGGLERPITPIAVARHGAHTYVLDGANRLVLELDSDWTPRRRTQADAFEDPRDLTVGPRGLWVTDAGRRRVVHHDLASGDLRTPSGWVAIDPGVVPHGVAVASDGSLYVTDPVGDTVVHLRPHLMERAERLSSYGGQAGIGRAALWKPRGIALDAEGRVLVNDHGNHRGFVLTPELEYVHAFGSRFYALPARNPERYPAEEYVE